MKDTLRVAGKILSLTFRKDDLHFARSALVFGLLCTWVVGAGRYWDHPDPHLFQRLGFGSVVYVFVLTFLLWILLLPLRIPDLRYTHLLTLITLTAPPAILYAIPVERFLSMTAAQQTNVWFLGIVALWRVAVYFRYLRVYLQLRVFAVIVAGLLPLCAIIVTLTLLNLEQAVFEIMAGLESTPETANDSAYAVLFVLSFFSVYVGAILLLCYLGLIFSRWLGRPEREGAVGRAPGGRTEEEG